MPQPSTKAQNTAARTKPFDLWRRIEQIGMFFEGRSREHKTMRRLVANPEKAKTPYAIMGAMAVNAHRHERTTKDVDILLTQQGFEKFRRRFVPKSYDRTDRPRCFLDRRHKVTFGILVTGLFPGSGKPGPIAFPDPAEVSETIQNMQVVNLPTLIQLKLAARRHSDFGDVVSLIGVHNLDESFLDRLHPSVHRDFIACLEEKRGEDEYEARQDRMLEEKLRKGDSNTRED
jgi:hypothetical protein